MTPKIVQISCNMYGKLFVARVDFHAFVVSDLGLGCFFSFGTYLWYVKGEKMVVETQAV